MLKKRIDLSEVEFLVIDDNQFVRRLLGEVLRSFGARKVQEVESPEAAFTQMQLRMPDIVLCDWMMSPMDGLEFLRKLRAMPRGRHTPVIMITGHATSDHVAAALGEGADSYIVKPFNPSTLMEHIVKVVTATEVSYI